MKRARIKPKPNLIRPCREADRKPVNKSQNEDLPNNETLGGNQIEGQHRNSDDIKESMQPALELKEVNTVNITKKNEQDVLVANKHLNITKLFTENVKQNFSSTAFNNEISDCRNQIKTPNINSNLIKKQINNIPNKLNEQNEEIQEQRLLNTNPIIEVQNQSDKLPESQQRSHIKNSIENVEQKIHTKTPASVREISELVILPKDLTENFSINSEAENNKSLVLHNSNEEINDSDKQITNEMKTPIVRHRLPQAKPNVSKGLPQRKGIVDKIPVLTKEKIVEKQSIKTEIHKETNSEVRMKFHNENIDEKNVKKMEEKYEHKEMDEQNVSCENEADVKNQENTLQSEMVRSSSSLEINKLPYQVIKKIEECKEREQKKMTQFYNRFKIKPNVSKREKSKDNLIKKSNILIMEQIEEKETKTKRQEEIIVVNENKPDNKDGDITNNGQQAHKNKSSIENGVQETVYSEVELIKDTPLSEVSLNNCEGSQSDGSLNGSDDEEEIQQCLESNSWLKRQKRWSMSSGKPTATEEHKLKMCDLIYWNPSNKPMSATAADPVEAFEEIITTNEVPAQQESDEENEDAIPVPQVSVGPDGKIIINQESLIMKANQAVPKAIVTGRLGHMSYYSKRRPFIGKYWSPKETIKFYEALSSLGTDFDLMLNLFPNRTRVQLKNKFKREDKKNSELVDKAIRLVVPFTDDFFQQKEIENDENKTSKRKKKKEIDESSTRKRKNRYTDDVKNKDDEETNKNSLKKRKQKRRKNILKKSILETESSDSQDFTSSSPIPQRNNQNLQEMNEDNIILKSNYSSESNIDRNVDLETILLNEAGKTNDVCLAEMKQLPVSLEMNEVTEIILISSQTSDINMDENGYLETILTTETTENSYIFAGEVKKKLCPKINEKSDDSKSSEIDKNENMVLEIISTDEPDRQN